MRLHEAHALLLAHATSDNAKHMKMLYADTKCGFTCDSLLCEYVDSICTDTDKWLKAFPESLKSLTAVSKPKTAFLKLLTIPAIMNDLGAQRCFDVADSVSDSYKKLAKDLSHGRLVAETLRTPKSVLDCPCPVPLPVTASVSAPVPAAVHMPVPVPVKRDAAKTALDASVVVLAAAAGDPSHRSSEELLLQMAHVIRELSAMLANLLSERLSR